MTRSGALCQSGEAWVGAMRMGCLRPSRGRLPRGGHVCAEHLKEKRLCAAPGTDGLLCGRPGLLTRPDGFFVCRGHVARGADRGHR